MNEEYCGDEKRELDIHVTDGVCYRCGDISTIVGNGLYWKCEMDDQLLDEASGSSQIGNFYA